MSAIDMANYGWLSILPPLIAIVLALLTKEVISSLLVGILAGTLIFNNGNIILMVQDAFVNMSGSIGDPDHANILIFLALLGTIVILVTKAGGANAYGDWAIKKIKTRRGASLATTGLGILIFIDDYFNCLTVGTVMRPVTDKHRISRAKLAYLLDATAAPICIIAPISSWGASVASYMNDYASENSNGMELFIRTIPYNLYAILTIIMVIVICVTKLNFGPMRKIENHAMETGDVMPNEEVVTENLNNMASQKGKVYDLIIPIVSLIIFTVLAMVYTGDGFGETGFFGSFGNSNASLSLVLGSFAALVITFILYLPRKVLKFHDFMGSVSEGIKSMVPAFTILILAWTIGGICSSEYLNTGGFIGNVVANSNFPMMFLPVIIFVVAAILAFATGTSWGTMAILIPVGAEISMVDPSGVFLIPVLSAVLAGAVYGDHVSPISDTTILSSTGAQCNHIQHVSTQLVYASVVAVCCLLGYILMGILNGSIISLFVSIAALLIILFTIDRRSVKNEE